MPIYIENQLVVKLLGLYVDSLLDFNVHIDYICRKTGRKLNVLARLSKTLSTGSKLIHFYYFILVQFEYCAAVWHFCSRGKNEKVREDTKTSITLFNDFNSSYEELPSRSNTYTLCTATTVHFRQKIVYKSILKQGPKYINDLFVVNENSRSRRQFRLVQPHFTTRKYGFKSLCYQASYFIF